MSLDETIVHLRAAIVLRASLQIKDPWDLINTWYRVDLKTPTGLVKRAVQMSRIFKSRVPRGVL